MLREQEIQKVKYRAEDAAEERILDALLPAARPAMGFGDEPAREDSNTRQLFRKRLREGQLTTRKSTSRWPTTRPAWRSWPRPAWRR